MSIVGKWMYNNGSEENWQCEDGEFDTKEEAIEYGIKFFTESDGYEDYRGESYEGQTFDVGQIALPSVSISAWSAIDQAIEQAGEQCGEVSENWLEKVSKVDQESLSRMLTEKFNEWLIMTKNKPSFFTIENIEEIILHNES